MKKLKIMMFVATAVLIFLGGAFFIIYNLIATNQIIPPIQEWKFKDKFIVSFKIKHNFLLTKNIVPAKILVYKKNHHQRLIDIIFEHQVPLYRFYPLSVNKLQQVIYQDTVIELEPYSRDIVCVDSGDVSVKFLRRIFNLETKILEGIIEILNTSLALNEQFEILKQYLFDNNFEKYYQIIVQIICI